MRIDRNALSKPRIRRNWQELATHSPVFNVAPSGDIDGVNVTFILPSIPASGSLMLFQNGALLLEGTDFTLSVATITFAVAPTGGDWIRATYAR